MSKLTSLEKEILALIFSSFLPTKAELNLLLGTLEVEKREYSALENGFCSGFFTYFGANSALAQLSDVPRDFSVQAKCDRLGAGEIGFMVFCDAARKSLVVLEGFLYGDDRVSIAELVKDEHHFLVYAPPGM